MRRIALINQKGGVGKTTTTVNLGAALAREGRRVVLVDLDPQANLTLHLDLAVGAEQPSTYSLLLGQGSLAAALRATSTPNLRVVPSSIDLSGAELELASAFGREGLLRDALEQWEREHREASGGAPADYVLLDCPPSLGLLSINGLVAAHEAILVLQTEFFALQGMGKLVEVIGLLKRRLNPRLEISGILPCLYDSRLKLAREVLAEIRSYFPGQVFRRAVGKNVKLAEAPSHGKTIFEYAPESAGALDYRHVALEVLAQEARDLDLATLQRAPLEEHASEEPLASANRAEEAPSGELRDRVLVPQPRPATDPVPDPSGPREPGREGEPSAAREPEPAREGARSPAEARAPRSNAPSDTPRSGSRISRLPPATRSRSLPESIP